MPLETTKINLKSEAFETPSKLWHSLMGSPYPVAIWRLPNESFVYGISDLRPQIQKYQKLEDAGKGFYVNPFLKHHPSLPQLIKSDLMVKWHKNKCIQTFLDARLNDQDINSFQKNLGVTKQVLHQDILTPNNGFCNDVVEAVQSIKEGIFEKVVLSRFNDQILPDCFDPIIAFEAACDAYPNAFVYLISTPSFGCWLGATPETLLEIKNNLFKTVSLASTQN